MLEAKIDEIIYKTFIKTKKKEKKFKKKNIKVQKNAKNKENIININIINSRKIKIIPSKIKRKKHFVKAIEKMIQKIL